MPTPGPCTDVYRWQSAMGDEQLESRSSRYTSPEFHRLEVETIWKRAWQMACREEDIPETGDHLNVRDRRHQRAGGPLEPGHDQVPSATSASTVDGC